MTLRIPGANLQRLRDRTHLTMQALPEQPGPLKSSRRKHS